MGERARAALVNQLARATTLDHRLEGVELRVERIERQLEREQRERERSRRRHRTAKSG
jgi:hypothetical protein